MEFDRLWSQVCPTACYLNNFQVEVFKDLRVLTPTYISHQIRRVFDPTHEKVDRVFRQHREPFTKSTDWVKDLMKASAAAEKSHMWRAIFETGLQYLNNGGLETLLSALTQAQELSFTFEQIFPVLVGTIHHLCEFVVTELPTNRDKMPPYCFPQWENRQIATFIQVRECYFELLDLTISKEVDNIKILDRVLGRCEPQQRALCLYLHTCEKRFQHRISQTELLSSYRQAHRKLQNPVGQEDYQAAMDILALTSSIRVCRLQSLFTDHFHKNFDFAQRKENLRQRVGLAMHRHARIAAISLFSNGEAKLVLQALGVNSSEAERILKNTNNWSQQQFSDEKGKLTYVSADALLQQIMDCEACSRPGGGCNVTGKVRKDAIYMQAYVRSNPDNSSRVLNTMMGVSARGFFVTQ